MQRAARRGHEEQRQGGRAHAPVDEPCEPGGGVLADEDPQDVAYGDREPRSEVREVIPNRGS